MAHSERAYRLNPFHSDMSFSYGTALLWDGQIEAAREMLERSFAINPYAPVYYKIYLSLAYHLAGRHTEGLELLHTIEGSVLIARPVRIALLVALDRLDEARAEAAVLRREIPDYDFERQLLGFPFKHAADRERLVQALLQAGLGG